MTFRKLALNNVRGSWQRYLAYFLSCVFSVATFYTFLSFMILPEVRTGEIAFGARTQVTVSLGITNFIIALFSLWFMTYSTSAFIRARKKEFGLLTLMGMTQREIRKTVFYELGIIALTALLTGLVGGIMFSKLFFMAMAALIRASHPIPFSISAISLVVTTFVFLGLFLFANVWSLFGVRASSIRELLKARHQPKLGPRKNRWLFLLGIGLTGCGYWLAWITTGAMFGMTALPIIGITVAGTYFLVTQGAVYVCDWLRRLTEFYRRGTNILVINRLVFRLTDNARAIFISAVLIAVVGSAIGSLNTVLQSSRRMALNLNPYALAVVPEQGVDAGDLASRIDAILVQQHLKDIKSQVASGIGGKIAMLGKNEQVAVASNASYNQLAVVNADVHPVSLNPGEVLVLLPQKINTSLQNVPITVTVGGHELNGTIAGSDVRRWLPMPYTVVVSDADYAALEPAATEHFTKVGFEFKDWDKQQASLRDVVLQGLGNPNLTISSRISEYALMRDNASLTIFIGLFIATLFFIAAGSLIYFKLFTEIGDDRAQYSILRDIGLTGREVNRLVSDELAALFFVPLLIGALHTAFALKTLSNLITVNLSVVGPGLMVGAFYLIAQTLYFLATRSAYKREVLRA